MSSSRASQSRAVDAASLASLAWLRLLVVLGAAVPALVFALVAAYRLHAAEEEAQDRVRRTLRVAHEHALKVFDTNETLLRRVLDLVGSDDDEAIRANEAVLHRQLARMAAGKPQIQAIWVHGPDARALVGNRFLPVRRDVDIAERPSFRHHQAGKGGVYLSETQVGRVTRDTFFDLSIGRYRKDGSFAGMVSVALYPAYFRQFHDDLLSGDPSLALTLFREDGAVFTRTPEAVPPLARLPAGSQTLAQTGRGRPAAEYTGQSSFDGRSRFVVLRKVGDYPAYVTAALETSAIRAEWLREMAVFGLIWAIPTLGLIGATVIAARRARQALQAAQLLQQQTDARVLAENALLQAQKLEAIGRLAGGVAHDFNNALMVLSGNLHLLRRRVAPEDHRLLDAMGRAVDSASTLTRQLLALSRKQVLAPQPMRLQDVLPAMDQLLHPVFGAACTVRIEVDPGTPPVKVDSSELELAVLNLAMNARDAMPSGGRFEVRAFPQDAAPGVEGPVVVVEARDTGTGIPPEVVERVFEPFFTTKPVGLGTGLGLSQVLGFAQRSGGHASVHSVPGVGTTVRVLLPQLPFDAVLPPAAEQQPSVPPVHRRVLLVEDHPEVGAAVLDTLESLGCTVVLRASAAEALAWLEQHPAPELLLTDVVMPGGMSGIELARVVQQRHPAVRILLMTGYSDQIDQLEALGLPVLHKPFKPRALAELLQGQRTAA
ncbi:MAG TPA: ATP-binding protein [Ramlibacter sp.]|jgi:signal transduction histidine kinase|uniref:ATP-binding protein n=1 Tax=Ramlibacter sp. TaxID=1917967 RepID=UPI002D454918|nr:ATP-binding protein [Ramlibacter sp.]HZY17693.1 ATP-binding protein [Ramlibacter sp.]